MTTLPGPRATIARLKKQVRTLVDESEGYKCLLREGVELMEATVGEVNDQGYKTPGEEEWIRRAREALK